MTTARTTTEIEADLAIYRAARTALIAGERVEDVSRDGRRMKMSTLTLSEINEGINDLLREHAEATSTAAGTRRRSAIGITF